MGYEVWPRVPCIKAFDNCINNNNDDEVWRFFRSSSFVKEFVVAMPIGIH